MKRELYLKNGKGGILFFDDPSGCGRVDQLCTFFRVQKGPKVFAPYVYRRLWTRRVKYILWR